MLDLIIVILILGINLLQLTLSAPYYYPYCSDLAFNANGQLDVGTIFYNCSNFIAGSLEIPSTYISPLGEYLPITVSLQMVLNNLISVDDIQNQITMDFFFRLKWTDYRWNISTDFWNYVNPHIAVADGISLLEYVKDQDQLNLWMPDVTFQGINTMEVLAESLKMFPGSQFYWSRHILASFTQPAMSYNNYPSDRQNFSFVLQPYAYSSYLVQLSFISNQAVIYLTDYQSSKTNIEQNQLWDYVGFSAYIENIPQPNFADPNRQFSMAFINLVFERQSAGIITRLIVPLAFLLLLSALTYWISYDNRVNVTITILVSVSALYIIILQNIPMVGYLTKADRFIFWMFLLLILVVASHQIYATMQEKIDRWPLRLIYLRLLEMMGRICVPITIIFYFQATINYFVPASNVIVTVVVVTLTGLLTFRETFGLRASFEHALDKLFDKINAEECMVSDLSMPELYLLNFLLFKKFSKEPELLSKLLASKEKVEYLTEKKAQIRLKHVHQMNLFFARPSTSTGITKNKKELLAKEERVFSNAQNILNKQLAGQEQEGGGQGKLRQGSSAPSSPSHFQQRLGEIELQSLPPGSNVNPLHQDHPLQSPTSPSKERLSSFRQSDLLIDSDDEQEHDLRV